MAETICKSVASRIYFFQSEDRPVFPWHISFSEKGMDWSPRGYVPYGEPAVRPHNYPPNLPYFPEGTYNLERHIEDRTYMMTVINPSSEFAHTPAVIQISTEWLHNNSPIITTWQFEKLGPKSRVTKSIQQPGHRVAESISAVFEGKDIIGLTLNTFLTKKQMKLRKTSYTITEDGSLIPSSYAVPDHLSQTKALEMAEKMIDLRDPTDGLIFLFSFKPPKKNPPQ
ncbi:MAG: hypothetical protein Q7S61_05705 [bacterium]|nr:hypothetical protein [bacterium]